MLLESVSQCIACIAGVDHRGAHAEPVKRVERLWCQQRICRDYLGVVRKIRVLDQSPVERRVQCLLDSVGVSNMCNLIQAPKQCVCICITHHLPQFRPGQL